MNLIKNLFSYLFRGQISETFFNAALLTISGGFQDAYTFILRDNVFANAQTGNIVLMSADFAKGNISSGTRYIVPVLSFILGIIISETIRAHCKKLKRIYWRQIILAIEIITLFAVSFIPQELDTFANALVSFVCSMQVQAFRKIDGNLYASTMCIGNLRTATHSFCTYCHTKDKTLLFKSLQYIAIITLFAIGAALGSILANKFGMSAIRFSCIILFISFLTMFIKKNEC